MTLGRSLVRKIRPKWFLLEPTFFPDYVNPCWIFLTFYLGFFLIKCPFFAKKCPFFLFKFTKKIVNPVVPCINPEKKSNEMY